MGCEPSSWTLKQISDALTKGYDGEKKIVIPMFQRGKRWSKQKEEMFIDSLQKKYPIGTLLFYKTTIGKQEVYTLIDGLQRGTTIKRYMSDPAGFFKINQISSDALNKVYDITISNGNIEEQKRIIVETIENYVHGLNKLSAFEMGDLFQTLKEKFPILNDKYQQIRDTLKPDFENLKDAYNTLCTVSIPAIVYTGDESTLPNIFARINSEGVPLTEYEIYAASWPHQRFYVKNDEIVNFVLKKYDMLNDDNYELYDYDREDMRINKKLTPFEYVFGFSKYICSKYECLGFYKNDEDDVANPVGFQLLNACFNTSHGQIKDVYKIIQKNLDFIDQLENSIIDSIEFVNKCISPVLKFKGNNRKANKLFHTQYQIMSLISFSFRKKYANDFTINKDWKNNKKILEKNIWKYYVYDILANYWGEGGTGKIHSINSEGRYLNELKSEQFVGAYEKYQGDSLQRQETKKIAQPSAEDYVILNTIYLKTFDAMDQLDVSNFDVEHLATKDQMKKLMKDTNSSLGLPISHIANICYLPEFQNRSKGAMTLYQDTSYLENSSEDKLSTKEKLKYIEDKYSFTEEGDLNWMELDFKEGDFEVLKEYYLNFLKTRSEKIKNKFLNSLGFVA